MMDCVRDLEKHGHLMRIKHEVDPDLEMAEIHRQVYAQGGPAIFYEKVKGSPFPAVSNIYGTNERIEFLFRRTFPKVQKVIELKADPTNLMKQPFRYLSAPFTALQALPMKSLFAPPITYGTCTISDLPQVKSWPDDGGAFITLPQVFTMEPGSKDIMKSNVGMYRIQLSGNDYIPDKEIGLHYQLHRGIGVHHTMYNQSEEDFRCCIFVGGPPSHAFVAIMPLPEGLSELTFAGMLGGRRFRYLKKDGYYLSADADFCITGVIKKKIKKDKVYHRKDAVWHFTVVGRPPAEDSGFGYLIHKLVKKLTTQEFPGVKEINAVDAAGVHPLLLAIGSERYMPFRERKPEEILTQANRILGSGQTSLAKFLIIAAAGDNPALSANDIPAFFQHVLERVDWRRDLHFQTKTTIDTLDYSGTGWNAGSKLVIACCGEKIRELSDKTQTINLPEGFSQPLFAEKGILAIQAPSYTTLEDEVQKVNDFLASVENADWAGIPLILLVDNSNFTSQTLNNWLWVTFTRANPSHDVHGIKSWIKFKHWGCDGPLVIDARKKPHHAPGLVENETIRIQVKQMLANKIA